jgi:hypothetical protein
MKDLQELLAEASRFKSRRSNLAQGLRDVDIRYRNNLEALESRHTSKTNNFEAERQTALSAIESRAKKEITDYIQMKNGLQKYVDPIRQWCPKSSMVNYTPNPSRVNEAEVNQLISMLQEQGLMAWIKRTFKLDGYSSRGEMALDLCRKIEDACAYCNERIATIEARAEDERNRQVTETRRKITAEQEQFKNERHEIDLRQKAEKEQALTAISKFDNSEELKEMHTRIERMRLDAESSCGMWGEYTAPTAMPEQVLLCEAKIALPNANGVEETLALPIWINLFECNIIVITSSIGSTSSTDCD